jgi:hypothetical protein
MDVNEKVYSDLFLTQRQKIPFVPRIMQPERMECLHRRTNNAEGFFL